MKTKLTLAFLMLLSFKGFSQLSTNETINYLDKKLAECEDLQRTYNDEYTYIITGLSFGIDGSNASKVILSYNRKFSDGTADELQYIFDPTHISEVVMKEDSYKDAVGMIALRFTGKTMITKQRVNGKVTDTPGDAFTFPYLRTEPINFERFKKALMHLKSLYAAKKGTDPFAN